jgi:hypothetical protein
MLPGDFIAMRLTGEIVSTISGLQGMFGISRMVKLPISFEPIWFQKGYYA